MNQFRVRLVFVMVILMTAAAIIISRLFTIQVLESDRYAKRSRDQTQARKIVTAQRGALVDRCGRTMAISMKNSIAVTPDVLGVTASNRNDQTVVKRVYPLGDIAGPLLGYIGRDGYGLGGAELTFDRYLRGEDGWVILQKDGRNNRYRKIGLPEKEPVGGCDVILTVDINVQKIVQGILKKTVRSLRARGGMCIVMDPSSGKILAMANEPSFNPNIPTRYSIAERKNKCISMVYEPGSTFKVVTASVAMQEKIKSEQDLIFGDNGSYRIYDQVIRDHKAYGYLTFAKALTYSSNICFAKVANEVGNNKFYRYIRDFGFGTKTSVELPGEEIGIVHPVKRWSGRTRVTMAMGQEISATLMQMMLPFAAVANGGILLNPRIVEKVIDRSGTVVDSGAYRPVRRVISEDVASRLRNMLRDVVDNGTGKRAAISEVEIGGKTGTSQKPDSGGYSQTRSWSSFIGFVPVEQPLLLCGVVIDEPAGGEMGGQAAAPAFRKIISQILSHPELEFAEQILKNNRIQEQPAKKTVLTTASVQKKERENVAKNGTASDDSGTVPDCTGKDLRDAVNLILKRGSKPYAVGFGKVERQHPPPGTKVTPAAVCTLFCTVKG
jgi:cell division protein FtsI (penicillin-binding protein 3)